MTPDIAGAIFVTLKILLLIGLALYGMFAAVMIRQ